MLRISTNLKYFLSLKSIRTPLLPYSKFTKLKSNEEREAELKQQRFNSVRTTITSALKSRKSMPVSEWKEILTELQKNPVFKTDRTIKTIMFDVLMSLRRPNDSMQNAKNFIESFNLTYDLSVKRAIIQLYAKKASEEKLSETEEQELIELCNEFIAQELHILPELHSIVVNGLCATKDWKRALDLSNPTSNSINILARKTLRDNDIESAWKILGNLTHMHKQHQHFSSKTIVAFAKYFERNPTAIPHHAEQLLTFCEKLQILFDEPTVRELTNTLQICNHHAKFTNVDYSGICKVCKSNLDAVRITPKDFTALQHEFLNNVVNGDDIYQKTTPEEWQAFEQIIKQNGPFDIVMDGLNVSYLANDQNIHRDGKFVFSKFKQKQRPCAYRLADVVSQLTKEGKRVLVVGRKHMNRWPKMDAIGRMATVFLVDNISKDDIFLLYAAMYSGQDSYILSNDYMRQHRFAIGPKFNALFKKWQQEHWYGFTIGVDKPIDLIKPMQFKMYTHKIGDYFHLPYKTTAEIESKTFNNYDQPKHWACIRIRKNL